MSRKKFKLLVLEPSPAHRQPDCYDRVFATYKKLLNPLSNVQLVAPDALSKADKELGYKLGPNEHHESGPVTYWNLCRLAKILPEDAAPPNSWDDMLLHALFKIRRFRTRKTMDSILKEKKKADVEDANCQENSRADANGTNGNDTGATLAEKNANKQRKI
ncbi:MAG: hypothetical protein M1820_007345 [Bogoriella megaspora]|nr:MAG: hypothetical protein M1820_007345 [Bogoriella megaspora]